MRKIKFRGITPDGEWVYGDLFTADNEKHKRVAIWPIDLNMPLDIIPETVGQFTGLVDKNEVEIYEGDIVLTEISPFNTRRICNKVIFLNGSFRYANMRMNDAPIGLYKTKEVQVIGNIHDNKELLGSE
jgi:uncharacterized phage protein (TIGR01671 family)